MFATRIRRNTSARGVICHSKCYHFRFIDIIEIHWREHFTSGHYDHCSYLITAAPSYATNNIVRTTRRILSQLRSQLLQPTLPHKHQLLRNRHAIPIPTTLFIPSSIPISSRSSSPNTLASPHSFVVFMTRLCHPSLHQVVSQAFQSL